MRLYADKLNWNKTVNCIYLLVCDTCNSQYVGETVQMIKDIISTHRGTTVILCSMCILVAMFLGVFYTGYLGLR